MIWQGGRPGKSTKMVRAEKRFGAGDLGNAGGSAGEAKAGRG
jgi:hypothetical protein